MKRLIIVLFIAIFLFVFLYPMFGQTTNFGHEPKDESTFEMVVTITYNVVTLKEAAKLDKEIRKKHGKACRVEVKMNPINNGLRFYGGTYNGTITVPYFNGSTTIDTQGNLNFIPPDSSSFFIYDDSVKTVYHTPDGDEAIFIKPTLRRE